MRQQSDLDSSEVIDGENIARPTSGSPAPIRVLVVDDHVVVRRGIRVLLETEADIDVVEEAADGREAVAKTESLCPDVILMDLVMPEMDGIEAIRQIAARRPEIRIVVLTSFATDDKIFPAIKAGALGYLLKDSSPEQLIGAIHQVYRGEPSLHPAIARKVLQELAGPAEHRLTPEPLTEEEIDILQLLARGQGNREIASEFVITERAVREHVSRILSKLHVASRTQAVVYALQQGLASLDELAPGQVSNLLSMLGKRTQPLGSDGKGEALPSPGASVEPADQQELEALRLIAADHQKMGQELALAGEIQASFLPDILPVVPGWQLAATLRPARETAGDFYDLIPLPDGQLGVLVADVADKGMGAALYMALSRTLIRTYAVRHPGRPEIVFRAVNDRILADTRATLFVTVFYGILDADSGLLTYSNAGHNPPYLLSAQPGRPVQELRRTGLPLGLFEDAAWEKRSTALAPGDALMLYTDGITEAQDRRETFFGGNRLKEFARACLGRSAREIQDAVMAEVQGFVGQAPQLDDMTLMVLVRDA